MKVKSVKIFVYGTLLSGLRNSHLLREPGCTLVSKGMLRKPRYFMHNSSYPAVIYKQPNPTAKPLFIMGEIWEVPANLITEQLDYLEGFFGDNAPHNLYNRVKADAISTEDGKVYRVGLYVLNHSRIKSCMTHNCEHGNFRTILK